MDEFSKLDRNDDGFLEPTEVLKLLAFISRDGSRPFAYLMQLQPNIASKGAKTKASAK